MATLDVSAARSLSLPNWVELLSRHAAFGAAVASLRTERQATFDAVWGGARALLAAALAKQAPGPILVVCEQAEQLDRLVDDLTLFGMHDLARFPAYQAEAGERKIQDEVHGERLRTLKLLAHGQSVPPLIVTCMPALMQPVPPRRQIAASSRLFRKGERLDVEPLLKWLTKQRFHASSAVELPGEYSLRGGILDIFPVDAEGPIRLELFDDEIDSIRKFDVATQRSLGSLDAFELTALAPTAEATANLDEYLTEDTWVLEFEPEELAVAAEQFRARLEQPEKTHTLADVQAWLLRRPFATASTLTRGSLGTVCRLPVESVERFSGDVGKVRDEFERVAGELQLFLVASTEAETTRLGELFGDTEVARRGQLHFVLGHLSQGFRWQQAGLVLISANELFQRGDVRRVARRHLGKALDSFLDLREGDLIVHLSHGIGRYRGIELLDKNGQVEEHLLIEFAEGARLYVPTSRIDLVQKYIGGSKSRPQLAKLGGQTWARQKKAVEQAVMDMAAEMLELQASRVARQGIAFGPDGEWQREFDASFPYEETPDQLLAIRDIKKDMQQSRPMDRLLCGDVGFGKTEVAMRAAFKAVDNGYQVAILVPTTVLAEQHFHSFCHRMAEFPIEIARLSRFCSSGEQHAILKKIAAGKVDIVIGTHRLASRDVQFHNLGLVVIDEEQRFGVEVKERLKTFRSEVDVLTMTATPIPRTLHMSLVGVRDISNLETPPQERVATETEVTRFNPELIRHAILRELNRGGQIYFIHNRVQDIEVLARRLNQIVPEASICIAHGQMPEDELEQVMIDFVAHRFDLLLATTIVESGLDIPNANTIFIDEADRYGLADLHQLRGRVGRYKHRAYCYLLLDPFKNITPNAAKRLHAIEEYSEMGAGFALAMRDLEIRGAGNLLGMQQSGHIATVGYEFYCQLLENSVRQLQKLPRQLSIDVEIDLPGEGFIPDDYVPDIRLKIDLYRRLRRASAYEELNDFRGELIDRFGPLPKPVDRMLALTELRMNAAAWQIAVIGIEGEFLVFTYSDRRRIEQLAAKLGGKVLRIVDHRKAYLKIKPEWQNPDGYFRAAKSVLRP